MKTSCPYCHQEYTNLPDEYKGQKANCGACGKDFMIVYFQSEEPIRPAPTIPPHIVPPPVHTAPPEPVRPKTKVIPAKPPIKYKSPFKCNSEEEMLSDLVKMETEFSRQFNQGQELNRSYKNDDLEVSYRKLERACAEEDPVPAVFIDFFKLCRKKNKLDMAEKNYQAVIDRIEMMLEMDKKQIDIIWNNMSATGPVKHTTKTAIAKHYCKITITDRKNLQKCKALLR